MGWETFHWEHFFYYFQSWGSRGHWLLFWDRTADQRLAPHSSSSWQWGRGSPRPDTAVLPACWWAASGWQDRLWWWAAARPPWPSPPGRPWWRWTQPRWRPSRQRSPHLPLSRLQETLEQVVLLRSNINCVSYLVWTEFPLVRLGKCRETYRQKTDPDFPEEEDEM